MPKYFLAPLLFFICLVQSCKEGCKDKTALNYDSKAAVENGVCLYCDSSFVRDTATYFFTCANAPNQNTNAIEFILINTHSSIWGNGCGTQGKKTGTNCNNYLLMVNLTNDNVQGDINVVFTQNNNTAWTFNNNNGAINMNPVGGNFDTLNFGLIDSLACSNISTGTLSANLQNLIFFP